MPFSAEETPLHVSLCVTINVHVLGKPLSFRAMPSLFVICSEDCKSYFSRSCRLPAHFVRDGWLTVCDVCAKSALASAM